MYEIFSTFNKELKMARRSYRQRRRFRRTRWSPNIQELPVTRNTYQVPVGSAGTTFTHSVTLAFNPTQVNTAVSQIYTVKNFEINFAIDRPFSSSQSTEASNNTEDITAYIMFVPQGMVVNDNYNIQHPEYIMAYKFLGQPSPDSEQQYQPFRIKTRMSRKLNTGDSVILFLKGYNTYNNTTGTPVTFSYDFHGLVRWWTKAN